MLCNFCLTDEDYTVAEELNKNKNSECNNIDKITLFLIHRCDTKHTESKIIGETQNLFRDLPKFLNIGKFLRASCQKSKKVPSHKI